MKSCKTIFAFLCICMFFACAANSNAQSWSKVSGTGSYVINKLFSPSNNPNLIIATSDLDSLDLEQSNPFSTLLLGNGIIVSRDGGNSFPNRYMDSVLVFDVKKSIHHPNRWFATTRYTDEGGVMVSEDDGATWNLSDMKCRAYTSQKFAIEESPFSPNFVATTAIGTDEGYNYSVDNFKTCTANKELDLQARCMSFSKVKQGLVFIGSDYTLSDGVYRSIDSGMTWTKYSKGLENLRVLSVLASSINPALVFCGCDTVYDFTQRLYMGRGIYVSQDTGRTWTPAGAYNSRVFDIKEHPTHPNFLAAACNSDGIFVSSASGFYWEQQSIGLPQGIEVRSVEIPNNEPVANGYVCFAGTKGDGIYKSTPLSTSVEDHQKSEFNLSVYPMPCTEKLFLSWNNPKSQFCTIEIKDMLGNTISKVYADNSSEGPQSLSIENIQSLIPTSGTYFVVIQSQSGTVAKSFIKVN